MGRKDQYYNKAKQQGYRARSAYKLAQIDDQVGLLAAGDTVLDLGAAPGGWLQVAAERVGETGRVIGVDFQRIDPLEDHDVETIRGDMTEDSTTEKIEEAAPEGVDVVVSDMAPNMTGEYDLDHARSVHLARTAFEVAQDFLDSGGNFVVKVFQGRDLDAFVADVEDEFDKVSIVRPDASRESSSEVYVVGIGYLTAPVSVGETRTVTIEATGEDGDGIAYVEGYTLFVPDTAVGDEIEVEVTGVKPRFGFAEPV
ncbi:RlmE family RNA methyltransferase [Halodesulfurarchaeum formicicum]|uniref:Ribosomal RNA large subunit methyltransferase E n=1 Tax=Halodesulfurarchaeum formicicum TaxID=1873524 RepID=A0A1J1AFA0_9EURY|nr:23S rRNA (uridine(2552)-2'-O)-methyltransferase [Halodesulfurarchaeum formicicum]APE96491.1 23S rRNA (uridine2552-2'-O)-methyltransferase [Halodesulfurarchaeum formicicum]